MHLLVFLRIGLAAVFALAGVAKLADREGSARAAREFGLGRFATAAAFLVPVAELAVVAALVPAPSARPAAAAAAVLLAAFAVAIAVALARGRRPDCHCFGKLHRSQAGPATLLRNAGLAGLAVLVATRPAPHAGWAELAVAGASSLVTTQAILVSLLLRRYGRALRRIEELEAGVEVRPALAVGDLAPAFVLPRLGGGEATLDELLEPARSLLLVFVDPVCGPCHELVPGLERLAGERLTPVLVSRGDEDTNAVFAEHADVLLQHEREVSQLYDAHATPSAILIGPDGRIEQPLAIGRDAIEELFTPAVPAPANPVPLLAAAAGVGLAAGAAAADAAPSDPKLKEIDRLLKAAERRLATSASAAANAVRAQATLHPGKAPHAKQAAARRALEKERRVVLALRASLENLTIGAANREASNARTFAVHGLDLFAQSLQKQERAIGAKPNVALALIDQSQALFRQSLDASATAAKLLGRGP